MPICLSFELYTLDITLNNRSSPEHKAFRADVFRYSRALNTRLKRESRISGAPRRLRQSTEIFGKRIGNSFGIFTAKGNHLEQRTCSISFWLCGRLHNRSLVISLHRSLFPFLIPIVTTATVTRMYFNCHLAMHLLAHGWIKKCNIIKIWNTNCIIHNFFDIRGILYIL